MKWIIIISTALLLLLPAPIAAQLAIPQWSVEKGAPERSQDYVVTIDGDTVPTLSCLVNLAHRAQASFAEFDMGSEPVVVRVRNNRERIKDVVVRPLSKGIVASVIDSSTVELRVSRPEYLSVEFNGDRQHNLHLFANPELTEHHTPDEPKAINWTATAATDVFVKEARLIYFGPGIHRPKDLPGGDIKIPSNCTVYFAPGAIVKARLIVDHAENVRIIGRGIIDHPLRGIEITYSKNVLVDGVTILNPQHYTVFGGQSRSITIRNIKSFSAMSWSDGIDLMSCSDIKICDCFLRTSDDCIALYNHRWWYWGNSRNLDVSRVTMWPDVAHPVNIGTHGDDRSEKGETLSKVRIHDCDILYARTNAALNISCGDKNTVRDVVFDDIRIEAMDSTAIYGVQTVFSPKYNRAPGKSVEDVTIRNVRYLGNPADLKPSFTHSYDGKSAVRNITFVAQ